MTLPESLYTAGIFLGSTAAPLLARGEGKTARGLRQMRTSLSRLERWAEENRDPRGKLVWFHAPSVGEGLQARAVIEALLRRAPETRIVYTFFSPSAERFASSLPVDLADYLPPDLPATARRGLNALRPDALVFTKTEVWPNYTAQAAKLGIPTALLSATLPAGSSRLGAGARLLLTPAHARLARVGAVSPADAQRFHSLGVRPNRTFVMGDARFDQVAAKSGAVDRSGALLERLAEERVTLVAGSTWREDESQLIPAFAELIRQGSRLRMILVPHEPTPHALRAISSMLDGNGIRYRLLGDLLAEERTPAAGVEVVVVDRTGILGDLYALADIAYVGGAFGKAGLHSVLEPAAFAVPVLFGPNHRNAREAAELVDRGGASVVRDQREVEERLRSWVGDEAGRSGAGAKAKKYVQENLGAADRGAAAILELIDY